MSSFDESIRFKNIFFDFDGVLAESVSAKTEAFYDMYLPYGEDIALMAKTHHLEHGGVSRFEKFRIYHERFLGKQIDEDQVNELANQFSELVLKKVIHADEVPGSRAFLEAYHNKINFWVITGTPTEEIEIVVEERGLSNYFIGLHGSPENKIFWTDYLLEKHGLLPEETLFLGDATTDQEAAKHGALHFALRDHEENEHLFQDYDGLRFKDFDELVSQIEEHLR